MGGGSWTEREFVSYSTTSKAATLLNDGSIDIKTRNVQSIYKQNKLHEKLSPYKVIRECCDTKEHPNTVPVILALDVTGSMGDAAIEVAAELNNIMKETYNTIPDVEFLIMGIGDLTFDRSPIQVSQFESDIRIAEQLDLLYFEFGGGPNDWESYTAAWAFGLNQTKLDCWNRGKKGIIITMGDEELNPYLPEDTYRKITGSSFQSEHKNGVIETEYLYPLVSKKFDIYHINVEHSFYSPNLDRWKETLEENHVVSTSVNGVAQAISTIIKNSVNEATFATDSVTTEGTFGEISW